MQQGMLLQDHDHSLWHLHCLRLGLRIRTDRLQPHLVLNTSVPGLRDLHRLLEEGVPHAGRLLLRTLLPDHGPVSQQYRHQEELSETTWTGSPSKTLCSNHTPGSLHIQPTIRHELRIHV